MAKRLELQPKKTNLVLAMAGSLGFVLAGLWIFLSEEAGLIERGAGALGVAFFAFTAYYILRAFFEDRGIAVTPIAFYWRGPTFAEKRIPWSEIESADVIEQSGQKFNRIRLKNAAALAARFSPEEAEATCRSMRTLIRFARISAPIAALGYQSDGLLDVVEIGRRGRADTLEELFAFLRACYGGEILLGWADRDRSAADLDALLQRYLHGGS